MMKSLGLAALMLAVATPALAAPDRIATEAIIHDYLLAHPEIIPEAMQVLQERQTTKAISENRAAIETPFGSEWEGDPHGDVTLVEFFDYNCGYCRASVKDIDRLLAEDKKLRVVYQEMPVLGAESDAAALFSLAIAQKPGNWAAFHRGVYANGDASAKSVATAAVKAGFAPPSAAALKEPAIRNRINQNLNLLQALRITGTPSWVVGNRLLNGAVGYDELKAAIVEARAEAKR